jgi:integrase
MTRLSPWNACKGRGSFGNIVRFLLLSGTRRGEIAKLRRDHIVTGDEKAERAVARTDRFVLPPISTKSGEQHDVPLTELMRTVIAAQPTTLSKLVFPSDKTGGVISGWTKSVGALQQASGVAFTLHDLRRTCRSLMSRLGVDSDIAELAIGHKREDLEGRYNFDEAWELRCEAFAKVSNHIAQLLKLAAAEGRVVATPARA